jgi:hypothetical protein
MSEDNPEHPLVEAIEVEDSVVAGDPTEALAVYEDRIEELEDALEAIDEDDPQRGPINLEFGMLRKACEAIREQYDVDQEGEP